MKNPFLTGKNIYLRALSEQDAEGNYPDWLNDAEVCRYNSHHLFPYSKEQALEYIKSAALSRDSLVLAIAARKNDAHIGNISLQGIDFISRSAEFAVMLGEKKYWGKGYSREAGALLLNHGFQELNLHRIYCGTSQENIPMQKLALSLGMKEEGRRRQAFFKHGKYLDIVEFAVLREEFRRKFKSIQE